MLSEDPDAPQFEADEFGIDFDWLVRDLVRYGGTVWATETGGLERVDPETVVFSPDRTTATDGSRVFRRVASRDGAIWTDSADHEAIRLALEQDDAHADR